MAVPSIPQAEFLIPRSWAEAAELFRSDPAESAYAGGSSYLMWAAARGEPLPRRLISLHRVQGCDLLSGERIGAATTLHQLQQWQPTGALRALSMAASVTASPAIRHVATLGGNLASGLPQADLVPALLALDCQVEFADGSSRAAVDVVAHGLRTDSLMTAVIPTSDEGDGWCGASVKLSRRSMDFAVANAAVALRVHEDEIVSARIAVGGLFDRPTRLTDMEQACVGADTSSDTMRELVEFVGFHGREFLTDGHGDATYRARIAAPLVERALTTAIRLGPTGRATSEEALL